MQIQASPDETNTINVLYYLPRPKPRNPVTWSPATCSNSLWKISHVLPWIPDFQIVFWAHAPPCRRSRPPIYETWDSDPHLSLHTPLCTSRIYGIYSTRRWTLHAPSTRKTITADVIWRHRWRHHSTLACHASPSLRQRHVIGWR